MNSRFKLELRITESESSIKNQEKLFLVEIKNLPLCKSLDLLQEYHYLSQPFALALLDVVDKNFESGIDKALSLIACGNPSDIEIDEFLDTIADISENCWGGLRTNISLFVEHELILSFTEDLLNN